MQWLLIIKGMEMFKYPQDATLMGLDTIHSPKAKNGSAALRQILDVHVLIIPVDSRWIWTWDQFHWNFYLLNFPRTPRTPKLDVVCYLSISFNVDMSWTSWTLDIEIISTILVESYFIWTWDWCYWKGYLVLFPCICRTSKSNLICVMYINLKVRWYWTPSLTRSQTLKFWIGLDLHLDVCISLPL
jgi:hypothetical protein